MRKLLLPGRALDWRENQSGVLIKKDIIFLPAPLIQLAFLLGGANYMQLLIVMINSSNNCSTLFTHRKPISRSHGALHVKRTYETRVRGYRLRTTTTVVHHYQPTSPLPAPVLIEVKRFSFLMFGTRTSQPTDRPYPPTHPPTHEPLLQAISRQL